MRPIDRGTIGGFVGTVLNTPCKPTWVSLRSELMPTDDLRQSRRGKVANPKFA